MAREDHVSPGSAGRLVCPSRAAPLSLPAELSSLYLLGLSAYGHDSAVALLDGGRVVSFVEEERLNREKHTSAFPERALRHVLEAHGLDLSDIDEIAFFLKPWQLVARRTARALGHLPRSLVQFANYRPGNALKILALGPYLRHNSLPARRAPHFRLRYVEHHLAHAAITFFVSPSEEAPFLPVAGAGRTSRRGSGAGRAPASNGCTRSACHTRSGSC